MPRDVIQDVLNHRRFSAFIGLKEDLWFEAKQNHEFDLGGSARHRIELSKDVCALANAEGGFLVVGLRTQPVLEELTDQVDALDLLPPGDFDTGQFSGIIAEYVFPNIRGLRVEWVESAETPGRGIGCITIPQQDFDMQPFLMKRIWDVNGELQQIVFGMARRAGSQNSPMTIEQLHRAVQQGRNSVPERLSRIEAQLADINGRLPAQMAVPEAQSPVAKMTDRVKRVLGDE